MAKWEVKLQSMHQQAKKGDAMEKTGNMRRGRDVASPETLDSAEAEIRSIPLPDTPGPYDDMGAWDKELGIKREPDKD